MSKEYSAGEKIFAIHLNEIVRSGGLYGASAVGTDSYAITVSPVPDNYTAGDVFRFKADVGNTGACTLNVNSLGAKTIKKNVSEDLVTGEILAGQLITVEYDGTNFQLINRAFIASYKVSDTLILSADTERTSISTTYEKVKEIQIGYTGKYRIKFDLKKDTTTAYGRIFKNGVAYGTEQADLTGTYATKSEDLQFIAGDTCELHIHTGGAGDVYVKNFRMYGDPVSNNSVITD